jgi:hypothetical protein
VRLVAIKSGMVSDHKTTNLVASGVAQATFKLLHHRFNIFPNTFSGGPSTTIFHMTKHKHFTKLADESDSSLTNPAIPLQSFTSSSQAHAASQSSDTPLVVNVRGGAVPGMDIEAEWPLNELPPELREPDVDDDGVANNAEADSMRTSWKRGLFVLLEDPSSSRAAFSVNVFVSFSIVLSAVLTTIETIPSFRATESSVW